MECSPVLRTGGPILAIPCIASLELQNDPKYKSLEISPGQGIRATSDHLWNLGLLP
jgi:hypothetical protein